MTTAIEWLDQFARYPGKAPVFIVFNCLIRMHTARAASLSVSTLCLLQLSDYPLSIRCCWRNRWISLRPMYPVLFWDNDFPLTFFFYKGDHNSAEGAASIWGGNGTAVSARLPAVEKSGVRLLCWVAPFAAGGIFSVPGRTSAHIAGTGSRPSAVSAEFCVFLVVAIMLSISLYTQATETYYLALQIRVEELEEQETG